MKKLLKAITKHTKNRFVEIKHGIPYYISTGKEIPAHCIRMPRKKDSDGLYRLSEYICRGSHGCRIGQPSSHCIKRGIVIESNCGKYIVDNVGSIILSLEELKSIVDIRKSS